jgi:hypothetical protein
LPASYGDDMTTKTRKAIGIGVSLLAVLSTVMMAGALGVAAAPNAATDHSVSSSPTQAISTISPAVPQGPFVSSTTEDIGGLNVTVLGAALGSSNAGGSAQGQWSVSPAVPMQPPSGSAQAFSP